MAARATALFLGSFTLLNLALSPIVPGFDANIWWIDDRILPSFLRPGVLLICGLGLTLYALPVCFYAGAQWTRRRRRQSPIPDIDAYMFAYPNWQRLINRVLIVSVLLLVPIVGVNIVRYYELLHTGEILARFPLSFSLLVLIGLMVPAGQAVRNLRCSVRPEAGGSSQSGVRGMRAYVRDILRFCFYGLCAVFLFPLAQMFCFGYTDYRRPADAAVAFGARVYADGRLSTAVYDRTRTAVELYRAGFVRYLIFSGGPGDGGIHETAAMRDYALRHGVPADRILLDPAGLDTESTVRNSCALLRSRGADSMLAVSTFYHLPRIKLTIQRSACVGYTVPARESRILRLLPWYLFREVPAFWYYYSVAPFAPRYH